jgi:hypothetical protein
VANFAPVRRGLFKKGVDSLLSSWGSMTPLPSFDPEEVELLVAAVQKTLEHLRQANERLPGDDPEILETGRRYAVILQKLQAVTNR